MNNLRGGTSIVLIILIVMYLTEGNYKVAILWGLIGLGINGFGLFSKDPTNHRNKIKFSDEEE
jgi:hypothetical protein